MEGRLYIMMRFEDGNTFKREISVESFACDMNNRMKLSAILREMQEIGNRHLDALGYPRSVMRQKEWAFLLTKIHIRIYRTPKEGDRLIQQTAPKKTKGIYFFRDINFYDSDGNLMIEANTVWILVSTENNKHSVLRPKVFEMPFDCDDNTDYTVSSWKSNIPTEGCWEGTREIRYTDIDCNRHMNNAVYADIVYDFMPLDLAGREIDEFRISFKNETVLGESIVINSCVYNGEQSFGVRGLKPGGELCFEAVVDYKS